MTIVPSEDASFSYNNANFCTTDTDPVVSMTGTPGGTYSSTPSGLSVHPSDGFIDLSASTEGTYTVQYITSSNQCADTATFVVTINTSSTGDTTATACDSIVWYGTTYTSTGTYTNTLQTSAGCDSVVTLNLTITPSDDASFAYSSASYCPSDSDPTPTVSGTAGGTFSSTAGLVIDANTGTIDLGSSSSGTYTVTYSTSNTEQSISTSNLFENGPNTTWPRAYVSTQITDGAASQNTQTFEINITSLPTGGANYRIAKTVANGNWFNGNAQPLSLGVNTITVASVSFDRSVKIQFSSGDIDFNLSLIHISEPTRPQCI